MPIQYYMRAYNTNLSTYVDWIVNDNPDTTGTYSGHTPGDLTNIIVNKIVSSKIDNKQNLFDPMNAKDGYFYHLNSYDWLHPSTPSTSPVPTNLFGLSIIRGYTAGPTYRDFASMFWDESVGGWKFSYLPYDPSIGEGVSVGAFLPVFTGTLSVDGYLSIDEYLTIGTNPAQSGVIRIPNFSPNDSVIRGRNSANSADVDIVQIDGSNRVKLGSVTDPVYVVQELLVGDHISQGLINSSTTGFIRLQNTSGIHSRNNLNTGNINLIETLGDVILIGDSSNDGISYNIGDGYHTFEVNDIPQVRIGSGLIEFDIDVDNPRLYQVDQTIGNGQTFTIQAQNTSGNTGGNLVLSSGTGIVQDGYVRFETGSVTKVQVSTNETLLYVPYLNFDKDIVNPIISQALQTIAEHGDDFTISAQSAEAINYNGGKLLLFAGAGNTTNGIGGNIVLSPGIGLTNGYIEFQNGLVTYGNFNIDGASAYFDIGFSPAQSGVLRVPNNISALSARNFANGDDIYLIGTDTADNIIIGDASSTTIITGNLTVLGATTTIHSTIVDIADRVVHFNYTTGIAPVPTFISGISIDRGSADGITNRDAASLIWSESNGYWNFGYVNQGDDLTITTMLPVIVESISIKNLTSDVVASSGSLRVKNDVLGAAARTRDGYENIEVWRTDIYDVLKLGTTSYDTNLDGYNVRINTNLTGDILFDTNNQAEHIYFDGLQKLYVNLMGANPYLKAENGAYIDLPGESVVSTNNFAINGAHVDGYVNAVNLSILCNESNADLLHSHIANALSSEFTIDGISVDGYVIADNLSTLCNGSNADALHTHTGVGGGDGYHSIIVGSVGTLSNNTDGYLLTGLIEISDESFPAYVINSNTSTINRLVVTCSQKPGVGESVVITVRLNHVDTALTVIIDDSTPAGTIGFIESDLVNKVDAVVGDHITIRYVSSTSANVQNIMATMKVL